MMTILIGHNHRTQYMALPQHYATALLTPSGRIDQVGFAKLAIALAFAHLWAYYQLRLHPDLPVWNSYTIALFGMLWMKFCILSRRLHDTGSSGFFLVPMLLITGFLYLCAIDPKSVGAEALHGPSAQFFIEHGMRIPRALMIAAFIYCVRTAGESGANAYGPEFGESEDDYGKPRDGQFAYSGNEPQHAYGPVRRASRNDWGERKRPAGFGRR